MFFSIYKFISNVKKSKYKSELEGIQRKRKTQKRAILSESVCTFTIKRITNKSILHEFIRNFQRFNDSRFLTDPIDFISLLNWSIDQQVWQKIIFKKMFSIT